ncbi:DUF3710 domain-containing protein [Trueperella bialowiezensis]|uniref:Protein of uncharacterized function (DUF3710) n=1 Tax=Trueperella bialowiezensis TaxID=312285 RepID=A0A3S5EVY0_9ACTO|nr:DUF3710 domain-containing protein [Trueperella bialowiezensis]VEI12509.1 Protein of uncharacterised function (DUF3710) [Trueperella bialowiezensis]
MWFFRKKKTSVPAETEDAEQGAASEVETPAPTTGPWDSGDIDDVGDRLDAGSLWIPIVPEASLQFSLDKARKQVLSVVYVKDGSALQLQAFAAPRSRGIWDDVRGDMRTSIANQGGSSQEVTGPFGAELQAQMPIPNSKNFAPHRFIGIDGPRWLLRVTIYGKAGSDEAAAGELLDIVKDVVVHRGQTPHPPRELLPLEMPDKVKKHQQAGSE